MNLLSFGLKNMGTIQSLLSGVGMMKQFFGGNNNFMQNQFNNPYMNPYNQNNYNPYNQGHSFMNQNQSNPYNNHNQFNPYNHQGQFGQFNPYSQQGQFNHINNQHQPYGFGPNNLQNILGYGNLFRNFFKQ